MLLFLAVPPAQVVTLPPMPNPALELVQERLEAIPEAFIDRKRTGMRALVAKAQAAWNQAKPGLKQTMPEPDMTAIDRQLKAMLTMKPREQAVGALGVSGTLSRFQPKSRSQDLLQADRAAMLAWCSVDNGQVERLPGVAEAFQVLIDQDKGQHALGVVRVQEALKRLRASQEKKHAAGAKKALKDLLNLVDLLEKP